MNPKLSQKQRVLVALIYLAILLLIFNYFGGGIRNITGNKLDSNIWFYAGALLIIMGAYLVEPFFTKPSDAVVNSIAVLIALWGLSSREALVGYRFILLYSLLIFSASLSAILLKEISSDKVKQISKFAYLISVNGGNAKIIFSIVYLLAAYSYFAIPQNLVAYNIIFSFWLAIVFFDVVGLSVEKISNVFSYLFNKTEGELGQAIGCDNPLLYKVEIDFTKHKGRPIEFGDIVAIETSLNIGSIGIIISQKYLLNKRWLSIYLIQDKNKEIIKFDLKNKKLTTEEKNIFQKANSAFKLNLDELDLELKKEIEANELYKNKDKFVGYVSSGSNINMINFSILKNFDDESALKISEGSILKTMIYGEEVLYQVVNGNAKEERLENFDCHGFIVGIARKLGKYNISSEELEVVRWMPAIYSPLFFAFSKDITQARIKEIASTAMGRLPETDFKIPIKDLNSLVTHNTAVLGILGIGKSCLAFELIKKISSANIKVICLDITNEYESNLSEYGCDIIKIKDDDLKNELSKKYTSINKDIFKGGNHGDFKQILGGLIKDFMDKPDHKVLIINPEDYEISIQTNEVKAKKVGAGPNDWVDQAPMRDLSVVEITRIISEVVLEICKDKGKSRDAKCLLVFEEAHSLIPEWNSVANKGDENATNGTAKVILQGRKYGLGSLIITQRTANVSKSILNQCNTIFALRVFDDTGKEFLENYIGEDYSNALPTLDERHAVAIGRGLKLKQPVIVRLNEASDIINP